MLKKFMASVLAIILAFLIIVPCFAENKSDKIENDFDTSSILVMIKKEYSEFGKEYYPTDFDEELIESVRVLNPIESERNTIGYNLEYWQQILLLTLKEPSKKNVEKAIDAALKNPQVESANKNYFYTVEMPEENNLQKDINLESESDVFDTIDESNPTRNTGFGVFPNDARFDEQGGLTFVRAQRAWLFATCDDNEARIGVMDTGIATHVDVAYNILLSKNFTDEAGLGDNVGHGTHVAGIIGATGNNLLGVSGVCWNPSIVNLKVMKRNANGGGTGKIEWFIEAIHYAQEKSIKVLNASLEFDSMSSGYVSSLTTAIQSFDGILVCTAGNIENEETIDDTGYPSLIPAYNIISVGSCDSYGAIADYSKFDRVHTDVFANGTNILSTYTNPSYHKLSGTSMAAPFVAGAIGLLLSINPEYSPTELLVLILNNADSRTMNINGTNEDVKVLNILKSVLMASNTCLGDANMDGTVTAADARLALRFSSSLETYTDRQAVIVDVNYDSAITAADARMIQNYAAGLIPAL